MINLIAFIVLGLLAQQPFDVKPAFATAPVSTDADDPAIWVNPSDPSKSLIIGTDKSKAPEGGLYTFNLEGKQVQHIPNLDRPNNVEVGVGLKVGNDMRDIAVATERLKKRLLIYLIDPSTGQLVDATGDTAVFVGDQGEDAAPMGIACYRRPKDGKLYAFVTPKAGPKQNHLAQYELVFNPATQKVDAKLVRRFGVYSGVKETESIAVDQELGYVYYSDETVGTHKYLADPDAPGADKELAFFNNVGTKADHEGIALWTRPNGTGLVICTDQVTGNSEYRVFLREGRQDKPFAIFRGGADSTDGCEATSRSLGPRFPNGIFVAMNSSGKNFLVYDMRDILKGLGQAP